MWIPTGYISNRIAGKNKFIIQIMWFVICFYSNQTNILIALFLLSCIMFLTPIFYPLGQTATKLLMCEDAHIIRISGHFYQRQTPSSPFYALNPIFLLWDFFACLFSGWHDEESHVSNVTIPKISLSVDMQTSIISFGAKANMLQ